MDRSILDTYGITCSSTTGTCTSTLLALACELVGGKAKTNFNCARAKTNCARKGPVCT